MAAAPCPFCRGTRTAPLKGYDAATCGYDLAACADCGTAFLDPMPTAEQLAAFYDDAYYGEGEAKFVGPVERISRALRVARARRVARRTPRGGRVLDVGCGRGVMLRELARRGYDVAGVELDTTAARRARANIGADRVFPTVAEALAADARRFDAVTFWHSLEHFTNPGETFDAAVAGLRPGGLVVLSLPNFGSTRARRAGADWLHLDLPRHVVHFDMDRLAEHLCRRGFEISAFDHFCQEFNVIDSLCGLYTRLGFHPLFPFEVIKNVRGTSKTTGGPLRTLAGLALGPLLLPVAAAQANLASAAHDGSTATLYLRAPAGAPVQEGDAR
ncbi:MAG: class I SAM-dependent methyltransferase [Desulfovibrionaceae bacterium]|jgi:2-polyprenyl-3-methyl-5-hydroxy-6-metoxy-1,4-benzoquinol methylase|nr:class I SAM-dependent methyltransferase [Desulfovibrionaceae bacterium]